MVNTSKSGAAHRSETELAAPFEMVSSNPKTPLIAGVLALQGAFVAHAKMLQRLNVQVVEVRTPADLELIDRLIIPGGESTTIEKMLNASGLREPLSARIKEGMPVLGTCAGMILLSREISDGLPDQTPLGVIDIVVRRNAFGRQLDSFQDDIDLFDDAELTAPGFSSVTSPGLSTVTSPLVQGSRPNPFPAVFIRAPQIEICGENVVTKGVYDNKPVFVRQNNVMVTAFHPELSDDLRIHQQFLALTH